MTLIGLRAAGRSRSRLSLGSAGRSGRYGRATTEEKTETRVVRQHMEASLLNLLRHKLHEDGRVVMSRDVLRG